MKNMIATAAVALPTLLFAALSPASASEPNGTWAMQNGKVTVKVSNCGSNLCARIVGLKET